MVFHCLFVNAISLINLAVGVNNSSSSVCLVAAFSCTAWKGNMTIHIVVVDQPPPGGRKRN